MQRWFLRILTCALLLFIGASVSHAQYRDPFATKTKRRKGKVKTHNGKAKNNGLKAGEDPFKSKHYSKKRGTESDAFASKSKSGGKKSKKKKSDPFSSTPRRKMYNKNYSSAKEKDSFADKNSDRRKHKSKGRKKKQKFILRKTRVKKLKESDSFASKPNKKGEHVQLKSHQKKLFPHNVNPAEH